MAKIRKNFRLEESAVLALPVLQDYYSNVVGKKMTETDVIEILINNAIKKIKEEK